MTLTCPNRLFLYGVEGLGIKLERMDDKKDLGIEKIIGKMIGPKEQ